MHYWEGEKIRLRSIEPDDWEFFYNWNLDTKTQKNLDRIWFPTSKASVQEWAQSKSLKPSDNDAHFFVIENLEGQAVGSINANSISRVDGCFRYGLGIIKSARRKGYAQEAIQIFLQYYFNELRYYKVNATVFEFNIKSIRLHEKMGFVREGQLRKTKYSMGKFWDTIIFGMTKGEFLERYG